MPQIIPHTLRVGENTTRRPDFRAHIPDRRHPCATDTRCSRTVVLDHVARAALDAEDGSDFEDDIYRSTGQSQDETSSMR